MGWGVLLYGVHFWWSIGHNQPVITLTYSVFSGREMKQSIWKKTNTGSNKLLSRHFGKSKNKMETMGRQNKSMWKTVTLSVRYKDSIFVHLPSQVNLGSLTFRKGWRPSGNPRSRRGKWLGRFLCPWPVGRKRKAGHFKNHGANLEPKAMRYENTSGKDTGVEWKWAYYTLEGEIWERMGGEKNILMNKAENLKKYILSIQTGMFSHINALF